MSYFISIKTAIIVFPIIACIFSIPFVLHQYHKYGSVNPFRVLIVYSFILYMITIYFLVILPLPNKSEVMFKPNMVRLVPFGFIGDIMNESVFVLSDPSTYLKALKEPCFYTVIFNVLMTIPFGMYLRYYFKYNLKKTIIISFLLSLFFEITQITGLYFIYPYPYRVFDVDDLIMNTIGGILGFALMGLISRFLPTREEIDEQSLEEGKKVSGLRRITIFGFDMLLCLLFALLSLLFSNTFKVVYIIFAIYYVLIPYLSNGTTLGSKFLNVRLEYENYRLLRNTLRIIFLYIYYFLFPLGLLYITTCLIRYLDLTTQESIWLYLMTFGSILLFYMMHLFIIIKDKKIYYDNIFKVKYISTIQ